MRDSFKGKVHIMFRKGNTFGRGINHSLEEEEEEEEEMGEWLVFDNMDAQIDSEVSVLSILMFPFKNQS